MSMTTVSDAFLLDAYSEAVTSAVERVAPAVVKIEAAIRRRGRAARGGTGSGFIFAADGLVLTNAHVVDASADLKVVLPDGRELDASTIGADADTDLAVVKVSASQVNAIPLGSSRSLKQGQL